MNKKKKILLTILAALLAVLLILLAVISVVGFKNVAAMNRCLDTALEELNQHYTVTALDPGEYKELTFYGVVKFNVEQYKIQGLGNLSVMRVNMGAMQMATFVITPQNKNLPLLSADYMYILSNRKAYLEFYDVVAEKDDQYLRLLDALQDVQNNYDHLEDIETSDAWYQHLLTVTSYKGANAKCDNDIQQMLVDSIHTYLTCGKEFPTLTEEEREEKLAITVEYTDGLIEKGGISTDVFKSQLGNEETKKFFDQVFFGTAAN
jgi:hypothetical protein